MPAIQLAHLKIQISKLLGEFDSPTNFVSSLKDLYEFYSDRTRKSGRGGPIDSITRSLNVPIQVSRLLERTLQPIVMSQPEQSLAIVDALWEEPWLEFRDLAFSILGWIPPDPEEPIINRIQYWGKSSGNDRLLSSLLPKAMTRLWKEKPGTFFELLESWLKTSDLDQRKLGLRAIPTLVSDSEFKYLPRIYNLLNPFIQQVNLVPDDNLVQVIRILAQKSPQETVFFLRRNLALTETPGIYTLIRQSLNYFPLDIRDELMTFLHLQRDESGIDHRK